MGVTKPRVAGSWALYWSSCVCSYAVLNGTGRSMKLTAGLTLGLWPKWLCRWAGGPSVLLIKPWWLALSVAELKVAGRPRCMLSFATCSARLFLERHLCRENSICTVGSVKYSWSQRCILKWMEKCTRCYWDATSARQILRLLVLRWWCETVVVLLGVA